MKPAGRAYLPVGSLPRKLRADPCLHDIPACFTAAAPLRCRRAAEVFTTPAFKDMRAKCIGQDLSWAKPAKKWEAILIGEH